MRKNNDMAINFAKAKAVFQQTPHWPHFIAWVKILSKEADTKAIMCKEGREAEAGRARAYREIIELLKPDKT